MMKTIFKPTHKNVISVNNKYPYQTGPDQGMFTFIFKLYRKYVLHRTFDFLSIKAAMCIREGIICFLLKHLYYNGKEYFRISTEMKTSVKHRLKSYILPVCFFSQ